MTTRAPRSAAAAAIFAAAALPISCGAGPDTALIERPIIYGDDDRREQYEVSDVTARATFEGAMVALVPRALARIGAGTFAQDAPSLAAVDDLCPGVPFAEQPAAAFCTGVLVDWDLVLTAGHCVRLFALEDFVVVRGYYYDSPGHLAVSSDDDIRSVDGIVSEALDPASSDPRLDFAWVHLSQPVRPPWRPTPVRVRPPVGVVDDPIISIGAGGGIPLKLDGGGRIREARSTSLDYFAADTDTAHGSSGGGAFDESLTLIGVLARGGDDLVPSPEGCNVNARIDDGTFAGEEFTYAFRAVEALCNEAKYPSSICRLDCDDVCVASAPPPDGGCVIAGGAPDARALAASVVLLAAASYRRISRRRRSFRTHEPIHERNTRRTR